MNVTEIQNKNTHTMQYNNGTITVVADDYIKPVKSCPLALLVCYLDKMDSMYGLDEPRYCYSESDFIISAKLFVTDLACYIIDKDGYNEVVKRFIEHNAFKKAMETEEVTFIAGVARYCQWVGMLNSLLTDAMYAINNAISDFVQENWSKENQSKYFIGID